jgi:hypothetical protein
VYAPVRQDAGGAMLAVTEFCMLPDDVEAEVAAVRLRSWVVVATIGVVTYLVLAGIVKRGSDTINRQQAALARHVGELERLLEQNARLHERVRQAAGRTTTFNEKALRRISADLHDGPGQALALALLRLDALRRPSEFAGTGQRRTSRWSGRRFMTLIYTGVSTLVRVGPPAYPGRHSTGLIHLVRERGRCNTCRSHQNRSPVMELLIIIIATMCALGVLATHYGYDSRTPLRSTEEQAAIDGMAWDAHDLHPASHPHVLSTTPGH